MLETADLAALDRPHRASGSSLPDDPLDEVIRWCAAEIEQRVRSVPGFAVLVGEGLEELDDRRLAAFVFAVGERLGRRLIQTPRRERAVVVRDVHPGDPEHATGYLSNDRMLLHTDAADVAVLLGLSAAAEGGASLLVSSASVYEELAASGPDVMRLYSENWDWRVPQLERNGEECVASSPIFMSYEGVLSCRYGSSVLRGAEQISHRPLTDERLAALDRFEDASRTPELGFRHRLLRGESLWFNNYRTLHGREAFTDEPSSGSVRKMIRIWLKLHRPLPVAPEMTTLERMLFGRDYETMLS